MSGGDSAFFDEEVHDALSGELERLTGNATFMVAEFADRDRDDLPGLPRRARHADAVMWEYRYEDGVLMLDDDEPDQWSVAMADPAQFYRRVAPRLIVRPPDPLPGGLRTLLPSPYEMRCRSTSAGSRCRTCCAPR